MHSCKLVHKSHVVNQPSTTKNEEISPGLQANTSRQSLNCETSSDDYLENQNLTKRPFEQPRILDEENRDDIIGKRSGGKHQHLPFQPMM